MASDDSAEMPGPAEPHPAAEPLPPLDELHINSLLVAVDGSPSAELALSAAVTAATRDNASVTILVVVGDLANESTGWAAAGAPPPILMQGEVDREAEELLRQTVDRMPAHIPVTRVMRHGKAGPEICAQAEEGTYDAILIGARGLGRVRSLLGSVSNYVMHNATTSVFVAHSAAREDDAPSD